MQLDDKELLAAWASVGSAQERWLVSDPLRFADVDASAASMLNVVGGKEIPVEVEIVTRPKGNRGTREEVFPDVTTSVFLQLVADRIADTITEPGDSLSIRLFGVRLRGQNPYDAWTSAVTSWLRSELDAGRVVIVCDLKDYFTNIQKEHVEQALAGRIAEPFSVQALRLLDAIHDHCQIQGRQTKGLPVCPADFFWLIADLVLWPLDREIRRSPHVMRYARWVDDLFISTTPSHLEQVTARIEAAAAGLGFALNSTKTRIFSSSEQFRKESHVAEHDLVSHLFATADRGLRAPRAETLIRELRTGVMGVSTEDSRLIKRVYGLAAFMSSPILHDSVSADLDRFPMAERAILNYLGTHGWADTVDDFAVSALESAATDSRMILVLRSLLDAPLASENRRLLSYLQTIALDAEHKIHPYTRAVIAAVLAKNRHADVFAQFAEQFLPRVSGLRSSIARRVAYEALILAKGLPQWAPAVRDDPSSLVTGLARLRDGAVTESERAALCAIAQQRRPRHASWGDIEGSIARQIVTSWRNG